MSLRELIVETIRQELPALAREATQLELQRQSRPALDREIELLFKHNSEVQRIVKEVLNESVDPIVDASLTSKIRKNDAVRSEFREYCSSLLTEHDGPLAEMLKVVAKTQGPCAVEVIDLTQEQQFMLTRGMVFVEMLARAVTLQLQRELEVKPK